MTEPTKLSVHLANVVAMVEQIGVDAEKVAEQFAGDVEGHLRVVESHLMEIINGAKAAPVDVPVSVESPPEPEPVPVEPVEEPTPEPVEGPAEAPVEEAPVAEAEPVTDASAKTAAKK